MAKTLEIKDLVRVIRRTRENTFKSLQLAILELSVKGEGLAKKNAARIFTGTTFRPKTGALLNAIFAGFQVNERNKTIEGFVGVRANKGRQGTKPYGRAHEFGAVITPKRAKWLWIPIRSSKTKNFENMTPSDFVQQMKRPGGEFTIIDGKSGSGKVAVWNQAARFNKTRQTSDLIALFALKKRVELPKRPFVTPAVQKVAKDVPALWLKRFKELENRN